ncbi:Protein of unknown function [Amycolatopsis arida]|uniref:DUF1203 domain-containing protein n=1 Tax=Amycolatopsis arida TaxID=587909 RepID=A0A1I5YGR2_9PSEU|nr:DUF1203 domain-containing protein [Amycolatopsis arida]TDX90502.1 uncharacterized protein DUF1203 [Amycolatopsis arida]SFQ43389.1 Protein of unknown function [Amycolatopsis arida]
MGFRIVPIDESVAKEVRATSRSPGYGHPAWVEVAEGSAPCRLCLDVIEPGVERLMGFTYDAFRVAPEREVVPLPGPVFVHERECVPYRDVGRFPPRLGGSGVLLGAYRRGRRPLVERLVDRPEIDEALAELCGRPDVDYVQVRSATAGCYVCMVLPV